MTTPGISDIARADGIHDFDKEFGPTGEKLSVYNASVPIPSQFELNEDKTLDAVLGIGSRSRLQALGSQLGPIQGIQSILDVPILARKFSLANADGATLAQRIGFDARGAALAVDFNQHGFLAKLKQGTPTSIPIYYLLTPEIVNDPAPKTPATEKIFTLESGLSVIPCIEQRQTSIVFPGNQPFDIKQDPHGLFFSKYTHTLSPIRDPAAKKLKVDLTITNESKSVTIKDSKLQNSIESLKKFLKKIFSFFRSSDPMDIATKWTQKRGGDWFQAIAARDIRGRTFINGLSADKTPRPLPDVPVYFVTHDRIALAYALLIGCNAIFLSQNENECYVFSRELNVDLSSFYTTELSKVGDLTPFVTKVDTELSALQSVLAASEQAVQASLPKLETVTSIVELQNECRIIFTKLLDYMYVYDIVTRYTQIKAGFNSQNLADKYSSYLSAKDIQPFELETFHKDPVYKSAAAWMWSLIPSRKRGDTSEELEKTDAYVFLPYLAELSDNAPIKGQVANAFWNLTKRIKAGNLPAIVNADNDRSREKAALSFASLATQVYLYFGFMQTLEDAELLVYIASITPKQLEFGEEFFIHVQPGEIDESIVQSGGSAHVQTLASSQIYLPLLLALNRAANMIPQFNIRPQSPILALLYALDALVSPKLQNSVDMKSYGRYIVLIEEFSKTLKTSKQRHAVWEFLYAFNATQEGRIQIAEALEIPVDKYIPYGMISTACSDYLFGEFRDYDFTQASVLMKDPEIQSFLRNAWVNSEIGESYSYEQIVKTHANIHSNVSNAIFPQKIKTQTPIFGVKRRREIETQDVEMRDVDAKTKRDIMSRPRVTKRMRRTSSVGPFARVLERPMEMQAGKPKRSKSSRRTRRVRRSDRAKKSEK